MEIRHHIINFSCEMEEKLREHDQIKGRCGWQDESYEYLLDRLMEEVQELEEKLFPNNPMPVDVFSKKTGLYKIRLNEAIKKCVNIANYSMMITDVIKRRENKECKNES